MNFPGNSTTTNLLAAVSCADTAAATTPALDLKDYEGPILVTENHGVGTGTLDGKIQDSADGSTDWQDVAGHTFTQKTTTASIQAIQVQSKQVRRHIRYIGTIGTGPHLLAISAVGVKKSV
jgi:hypothetical protein